MVPLGPHDALQALADADITHADTTACGELLGHTRRLRGWLDAVEASITSRTRELHAAGAAAPAADLHTRCGGVSAAEGRRKQRRSETLDEVPSFGDALADGTIGAEHVDALANATAKLDTDVRAAVLAQEGELLGDATRQTPEEFGRSVRDLARRCERDNGVGRNQRQRNETFLTRKVNHRSGMVEGRFAFHPELAAGVFGPLDRQVAAMIAEGAAAGDPDCVNRTVDRNRLAAEALGELVAGGHQRIRPTEAEIIVITDRTTADTGELHHDSVCETVDGLELPPATIRRLCCQGRIVPIVVDGHGSPFDMGRTIRHANRNQRRALRTMYRTCAFSGCDVAFDRCEIHHVTPFELGGPSDLANLLPLCSRHHHVVHELGWVLELAPDDRTLTIRQPGGAVFATSQPEIPAARRRARERARHRPPAA